MTTVFEPRIELPENAAAPDVWDESLGPRLPPNFVVSRYRDGTVASLRGHMAWNWSPYDPKGESCWFYFDYWRTTKNPNKSNFSLQAPTPERRAMVDEVQHLLSLRIYKTLGATLSPRTLQQELTSLNVLARYCEAYALRLQDVLSEAKHLIEYARGLNEMAAANFARWIGFLSCLDPDKDIGFHVACNAVISNLRAEASAYHAKRDQTAPIPTRIYSGIITSLSREMDDWEAVEDRYLELVRRCVADKKRRGDDERSQGIARGLISKRGLDAYFDAKGLAKDSTGASKGLANMQMVTKLVDQTFSGMRSDEAKYLPYHCMETERTHGRTHHIICGKTTKLEKGKVRRTKWVSNQEGHRATRIAQRIADVICKSLGCVPTESNGPLDAFPLFVSTKYLGIAGGALPGGDVKTFLPGMLMLNQSQYAELRERLRPLIEETDLRELEKINPHRAWRAEKAFQVGQPWPLRTHQLRRSLALYAQRSGLVSLPSLRRQLQHLTKEMSLYYANGSIFAKNFIENDPEDYQKHFCKDWREAKPISEALTYLREVIFSDEPLYGGAGAFEQQKKNRGQVTDRQEILRRFKKGEIAYKENPLGGCVKVGACDQPGLDLLDSICAGGCKNLVGKMSHIERAISREEKLIAKLNPESFDYRMEKRILDQLTSARYNWSQTSERRDNSG